MIGEDWYAGWNIYAKRIFADYRLYVDGERLLRENARTSVYPDKLVRRYEKDCGNILSGG